MDLIHPLKLFASLLMDIVLPSVAALECCACPGCFKSSRSPELASQPGPTFLTLLTGSSLIFHPSSFIFSRGMRTAEVVGWYHSHPGYGCWLSGIDVQTQMLYQQHQEPFVAVPLGASGAELRTATVHTSRKATGWHTRPSDV